MKDRKQYLILQFNAHSERRYATLLADYEPINHCTSTPATLVSAHTWH